MSELEGNPYFRRGDWRPPAPGEEEPYQQSSWAGDDSTAAARAGYAAARRGPDAPPAGWDREAPASGSYREAPASGSDREAPASGSYREAPASGSDREAPASGSYREAPASGWDRGDPYARPYAAARHGDPVSPGPAVPAPPAAPGARAHPRRLAPKRGLPKPFGAVAAGNGHQAAAAAGSVARPVPRGRDAVVDLRPGAPPPATRNGSHQPPAGGGSNATASRPGFAGSSAAPAAATMLPAAPLGGEAAPAAGYRTASPGTATYAPPAPAYPAPPAPAYPAPPAPAYPAPPAPAYPAPAPPGPASPARAPGVDVASRGPRRLIAEPKWDRGGMAEQIRRMATPLAIFAASRALIYTVLLFAERLPGAATTTRFLAGWQGSAYLSVASRGYPQALVASPGGSELGYFPLYPMLIRSLHRLSGLSFVQSAIAITLVCSALAMVVAWLVVERLTDRACATRAVVLASFFPWAFVFSMVYSEGLLLLLAGICLLALLDGQWLTAGLAALLAGVSAPFGFVLFFPCAWAAARDLRRRGTMGALIAPVLAPVGVLAFFLYLQGRTGNVFQAMLAPAPGVTYAGIGRHPGAAAKVLSVFLHHPTANLNVATSLLAAVLVVAALIMMAQWKPPAVIWAYTVPLAVLGLWLDSFASLPRTMLVAFPLVVAIAWRIRRSGFWVLAGVSAGLMATLFVVTGVTTALTP